MNDRSRPPPKPPQCLVRSGLSSSKGGRTLIAEDVVEQGTHKERLCDPEGYRPAGCPGCGHWRVHIHDYRSRGRAHGGTEPVRVVRYLCPRCGASFQVLPAFVARHLWHRWETVEAHMLEVPSLPAPPVPSRTLRRWRFRLACAATVLLVLLATSSAPALERLASQVGLEGTRSQLVRAYQEQVRPPPGQGFSSLAAQLHRLRPGVRLI